MTTCRKALLGTKKLKKKLTHNKERTCAMEEKLILSDGLIKSEDLTKLTLPSVSPGFKYVPKTRMD